MISSDLYSLVGKTNNLKIQELLQVLNREGYLLKTHEADSDLVNVFCFVKRKNVIGDIRIRSKDGSFRLEDKETGKWFSYKKFGFSINDDHFINYILNFIKS